MHNAPQQESHSVQESNTKKRKLEKVKCIKAPPLSVKLMRGDIVGIYDTETISKWDKRVWELSMKFVEIGGSSEQPICSMFERFDHADVDETSLKWHADQRKISTSDVHSLIRNGKSSDTIGHYVTEALRRAKNAHKGTGRLWLCAFNESFDRDAMAQTIGMHNWMDILANEKVHAVLDYKTAIKHVPCLVKKGLNGNKGKQEQIYDIMFNESYSGHQADHDVDALARIVISTSRYITGRVIGRDLTRYREHSLALDEERSKRVKLLK